MADELSTRGVPEGLEIEVQCADGLEFPSGADVEGWFAATLAAARVPLAGCATLRLVGEQESATLNSSYRHKAGPTNVLAFNGVPEGALPAGLPRELGDIVVCLPVIEREAAQQSKTLLAHFAHMVVHGTLHLLGYDHEEAAAAAVMEQLEVRVLGSLGYADPYDDAVARQVLGHEVA